MIAWFPVEPCAGGAWIFIPPPTVAYSCSHAPGIFTSFDSRNVREIL